jgi:Zn-dependent membrane protease YugP
MGIQWIIFIGVMIASWLVQQNLQRKFKKYSAVRNESGLTGQQIAEKMLRDNGIYDVRVTHVSGQLTDHYNPVTKTVNLSQGVYESNSVMAAAVAAHECGHACQHAENYAPIIWRTKLVPITNICSRLWYFVLIIGVVLSSLTIGTSLIYVSIAMFLAVILFQLVTLPCEFNASNRALKTLERYSILELAEVPQAKKVLTAAALTYVTSLVVSMLQLLRLLMSVRRR